MCGDSAPGMIVRVLAAILLVGGSAADERLQLCLDGFVVHRDKIIRTQDSRSMGAKYLTVVDVEARIDCMKWCCETEHCDVFIFEEKKPGSCYLFHCGPPQDFKCKFTGHANYSSAVLTNYDLQKTAALEEQIRRTEQEHELQSLRKMESPSKEYSYFTRASAAASTTSTTATAATTAAYAPLSVSTQPAPVKSPLCSHNQFECRSNDDCIAIYNVCDGIPQCADGSDEATDLGCPVDKTTMPPPPPPPPPIAVSPKPYVLMPQEVIRYQQMMQKQQQQQQHGQYSMVYPGSHLHDAGKAWLANSHNNPHQLEEARDNGYYGERGYNSLQHKVQMQQSADESVGSNGPPLGMGQQLPFNYKPSGYQWSNYQSPIYEQGPNKINGVAAYDAIRTQNALPPPNYEQEQSSRIFNHKGPGVHFEDIETVNGGYGQDPNQDYLPYYPGPPNHRENSWQEGNSAQSLHAPPATSSAPQRDHPDNVPDQQQPSTSTTVAPCDPTTQDTSKKRTSNGDEILVNSKITGNGEPAVAKDILGSVKKMLEPQEKQLALANNTQSSDHKAHEVELRTLAETHVQEQKKVAAVAEHIRSSSAKLNDLEISRPKGAVISLALGLSVTAVMAVLIACRLRVVKRSRGRSRGHDSYSHDADYLVNGMYL